MTPLEYAVVFAAGWFSLFVFGHVAWAGLLAQPRYGQIILRSFIIALALDLATMLVIGLWAMPSSWPAWLLATAVGLFLMACAFVLYIPFVFVISSSLSVDTMIFLDRQGGSMGREALYRLFVSPDAVRRRLALMRTNGLVTGETDRYVLTAKAARTASFFTTMKHFWKLWPGG